VPPTPDERHILLSKHVKIPPFKSVQSHVRDHYNSTNRTTRLATVTAAAALAAVAAGVSASPAMASTGTLASTSGSTGAITLASASTLARPSMRPSTDTGTAVAASQPGPLSLDAASMIAPLGHVTAHEPLAPIALPAPVGPLAPATHSAAAPHRLPAPGQPVVRIGVANANNHTNTAAAGNGAGQHPAAPSQPAPAPAPKPYLLYDSVTPQLIPAGQPVATYATGGYAVPASAVAGRSSVLWIDTQGTDTGAQALDVEPGDATPQIAASWAWHKLSATPGAVARIYTMISEWPAVKAAIATLPQQMQSRVHYWIADPTGVPHVVPGSDATQWYWGQNYDISTANPGF
jgi:hypothetical protein